MTTSAGSDSVEIQPQSWLRARPDVDASRAEALAQELFAVSGKAVELGSQQDRNYKITEANGSAILLKINHSEVLRSELDLQLAVSTRLASSGIDTPAMLPSVTGEHIVSVDIDSNSVSQVCAFDLVPGNALSDLEIMTGVIAEELGVLAGRTVQSLSSLQHEASSRDHQWELGRGLDVVEMLIGDLPEERREICLSAARLAASAVKPLQEGLPKQIIHGDLVADNVICDDSGTFWVIDFGDTGTSWRVSELAVLAADILGRTGSLAQVGRAVRGFCSQVELLEDEIQAIWPLVVLRGAVLAVSGFSQLRIDPTNSYARERVEHEWKVFSRATHLNAEEVTANLRMAAGKPHRPGLSYGPLLAAWDQAQTVDLGIRSEMLDRGRWTEPDIEQRLMRSVLQSSPIAIARFGEARLSRVSTNVSLPANTRARHVELRARPGVEVYAPFAGSVRRFAGGVELHDLGVSISIEGLQDLHPHPEESRVEVGAILGRLAEEAPGIGRLTVSRSMLGADLSPQFVSAEDEYEADGAADPSIILGVAPVEDPLLAVRAERRRRDQAMGNAAERYYAEPPQIERGWDTRLIDTQGRAYLDMVNNVTAIGHSHPHLADTVGRQLHLLNTNSRFLYQAYADFTDKLLAYSPDPSLDTVIPVNSGSEAVDLAIRMAQAATGRRDVIAVREGYHGWTMAADSVSTSAFDNPAALDSRPDWVHLVDAPNAFRGVYRGPGSGKKYAQQVEDLVASLTTQGRGPAAFICEPVLGNAGGVVPPEGFLTGAYAAVRGQGGLVIADEVQVGYGRLGAAFWGSQLQGAIPDIITVAKAAGNAFPVGAVITRREIADALRREGMFFSSAAGAPASAVAGAAVLEVIRSEGLQENALRVGQHLKAGLESLSLKHALVGPVHGNGLYLGVELIRDHDTLEPAVEETQWICERLLGLGIIMQATSERQNVLKVKPPMTLTKADADIFIAALDQALAEYVSHAKD